MSDTQTLIENRPPSVATLFLERVAATPDAEAYRYPVPSASGEGPGRLEVATAGAQAAERVYAIAAGLIALGVRPEERVALASTTRVEWILADLGILCAGAATTTVYPQHQRRGDGLHPRRLRQPGADRRGRRHSSPRSASSRAELPELTHVVRHRRRRRGARRGRPRGLGAHPRRAGDARRRAICRSTPTRSRSGSARLRADQLATLIYTSGTTGRPKGVRLPHDCWSYMAKAIAATGLVSTEDVQYLWLPLAHVFGKVLTAGQIEVGHVTAVDGRVDKIIENLPVVQPTYMAAVPRIFEKVYNGVAAKARAGGGAKYKIFQWAAGVAREYAKVTPGQLPPYRQRLGARSGSSAKHKVADALVYAKLREAFGGRLRACVSGSAALAPDIGYFFSGAGIHILEGYGLTESSAASFVNPGEAYRTGTVGKPLPGTEVRIADDGEILLRGPGIMQGYHGLPDKTAEVLEEDGWFHTGDIGELSADGYLRITDRKKDLIKTSGGKYIAPAEVEGQFKAVCPYVSNILVHGADRNFCTALIALDEPAILGLGGGAAALKGKPYAEVVATRRGAAADRRLRGASSTRALQRWQTIKKFRRAAARPGHRAR